MRALLLFVGGLAVATAIVLAGGHGDAEAPPQPPARLTSSSLAPSNVDPAPAYKAAVQTPTPPPLVPAASGPAPAGRGLPPPAVASAAALLLDDASGKVLFEHNGHVSFPPASLTKIVTAIVAVERGDLDSAVEVGPDLDSRTMRDSSVMGLQPGDRFPLRDLLYGLMLPSGNDAAIAIARHIAGSDGAFVTEMNDLVKRLGLKESQFSNPHGLSGIGHTASAYDLAMLSRYAMTLPVYREIASADTWTARGSREIPMYSLVTEARWHIDGVDAAKSGYTRAAGRTLVVSVERNGRRLHAVVMNDPDTEATAGALIDWGFANFDWSHPGAGGSVAVEPASAPAPADVPPGDADVEALRIVE